MKSCYMRLFFILAKHLDITKCGSMKTLNFLILPVCFSIMLTFVSVMTFFAIPPVSAQATSDANNSSEVISILLGASDERYTTFFEPRFQLIEKGQSIVWSNPDGKSHQLLITKEGEKNPTFETQLLHPGQNQSFAFQEPGMYHVKCSVYPWMKGDFFVADQLNTMVYTNTTELNIEMSWYPLIPNMGETTYFKINFLDKNNGRLQEHVDYQFAINDSKTGQELVSTGIIHTVTGQDIVAYSFEKQGSFTPLVSIKAISFLPTKPDYAKFSMAVTPEFQMPIVGMILATTTVVSIRYWRKK